MDANGREYVENKLKSINLNVSKFAEKRLHGLDGLWGFDVNPLRGKEYLSDAVQLAVELFNYLCDAHGHIIDMVNAKPDVTRRGNVTHIVYNQLLPLKAMDGYLNEASTIWAIYIKPLNDAVRMSKLSGYSEKVVLCFVNHYKRGSSPVGHHGYALKQIIDGIAQCFLQGDGPNCVSYYSEDQVAGSKNYSEVYIVPYSEFAEFAEVRNGIRMDYSINIPAQDMFENALDLKHLIECLCNRIMGQEEMLTNENMIVWCWEMVRALKATMYDFFGIRGYSPTYTTINPREILIQTKSLRIRLDGLMPHRPKGNTRNAVKMQLELPWSIIKRYKHKIFEKPANYVICFVHHYGPGSRLVDHDNLDTQPYYEMIASNMNCIQKRAFGVFMDAVTDDENTYSEIFIVPAEKFQGLESLQNMEWYKGL